jgi:ABC-type glycerol-3-phosphate transport system substrate-binding protein
MRKITLVMALLICVAVFGVSTIARAQQDVTLTAWTHDQLYIDYFNSRTEEWAATHPDVNFTFDFQVIPNAWDRALEALAAGEPMPDLLGLEQGGFPNFMKNDVISTYFVDLTDIVAPVRDQYAEGRFSIYSHQGRLYALESSLTASVYYYQPAIFEAHGVEVPATWEEAMELARTVFGPENIALNVATDSGNWFQMLYDQKGGQVFDENANFVFSEEANRAIAVELATFLKEGVDVGLFFFVPGTEQWGGVTIPTAYREGRLAGQMMPDWWSTCCLKPGVADMEGQWRIAPAFRWEDGGYGTAVWGGTGWTVSSQSANVDLAVDFLTFMYLGKESQIRRFEQINMFPNMLEAAADPRVTELEDPFYGGQKIGEIYATLAPEVPVWYQSPFRSNWSTAVTDNLPLLFDGTLSPEAFVDEVTRITQDAIDFGF